jgi:hypothetical protein
VKAYLAELRENVPFVTSKWRCGVLLVNDPTWFTTDDRLVPYRLAKQLRRSQAANDGFIAVDDLLRTAMALTDKHLHALMSEFREMDCAANWRRLLTWCGQSWDAYRRLCGYNGLPLTPVLSVVLGFDPWLPKTIGKRLPTAVRLAIGPEANPEDEPKRRAREVRIEMHGDGGAWFTVVGFRQIAAPTQ